MFQVRRIGAHEGAVLRDLRLAALADAPGDATTTLARARAHDCHHWEEAAAANASGPLHATFVASEAVGDPEQGPSEGAGMVGAYANKDGTVNIIGLWSAPGHRDQGVAEALLDAVAVWAGSEAGARRLRLWVVERNGHARAFYEGQGFRATGSEIPYQPEPRIRQLEMVRDLPGR
ncbi:MAG: GNAT family N-acetyltransferase [Microthrixaceae bacterium]|nr:GNAT family N-acetyltransferase [Microthrixaceae bacterium]